MARRDWSVEGEARAFLSRHSPPWPLPAYIQPMNRRALVIYLAKLIRRDRRKMLRVLRDTHRNLLNEQTTLVHHGVGEPTLGWDKGVRDMYVQTRHNIKQLDAKPKRGGKR